MQAVDGRLDKDLFNATYLFETIDKAQGKSWAFRVFSLFEVEFS